MFCRTVKSKLFDYIDKHFPPTTMERITAHLEKCPRCSAELERIKGLKVVMGSDSVDEIPAFMWEKISNRLRATKPERVTIWTRAAELLNQAIIPQYSWLPAAFAAVFLFAVVYGNSLLPYKYRDLNTYLNEKAGYAYDLSSPAQSTAQDEFIAYYNGGEDWYF
ncbi:MAG: zf-HC2 domain-containing protein [Candidatus Margulisiibacteriota bacterium]